MAGRIVFDQVWKRFHRGPAHDSLRDLIPALARRMVGRGTPDAELSEGDFWAVRDVSFEVKPGEALGIIGGNGAGKSTTLKLLTKILRPTRGTALVEGRVGSLIEVSAGFHPDLSGRENVFLQGAIMGMPQRLIREQFDAIVEFSGISAFIDTPVKRYSSGMNARLGFSIAVHLEPDVLIIDEVLSVGDAEFQERAFERIRGLVRSDIPVVIVSHQLDRIVELCTSCLLLAKGELVVNGRAAAVVQRYLGTYGTKSDGGTPDVGGLRLDRIALTHAGPVRSGEPIPFELHTHVAQALPEWIDVALQVRDATTNTLLYGSGYRQSGLTPPPLGTGQMRWALDANLPAGVYLLEAILWDGKAGISHHGPTTFFEVIAEPPFSGSVQLSLRDA